MSTPTFSSRLEDEEKHEVSRRFISVAQEHVVHCPSLVMPEVAGALSRRTGSEEVARQAVARLTGLPGFYAVVLTIGLASSAAAIAAEHSLRGADAVYVATAVQERAVLVTWDSEMLERGAAVVTTQTPEVWLASQP